MISSTMPGKIYHAEVGFAAKDHPPIPFLLVTVVLTIGEQTILAAVAHYYSNNSEGEQLMGVNLKGHAKALPVSRAYHHLFKHM